MNAAQHLERAEQLLGQAHGIGEPGYALDVLSLATEALAHATVALAIEAGAPHAAAPAGVTPGGQ